MVIQQTAVEGMSTSHEGALVCAHQHRFSVHAARIDRDHGCSGETTLAHSPSANAIIDITLCGVTVAELINHSDQERMTALISDRSRCHV